ARAASLPVALARRSQMGSQSATVPATPCSPGAAVGSRWRQTPHDRASAGRAAATASSFQPGSSLHSLSASTRRGGGGVGVGAGDGGAGGGGVGAAGGGVGAAAGWGAGAAGAPACAPLRGARGAGEPQPATSNAAASAA